MADPLNYNERGGHVATIVQTRHSSVIDQRELGLEGATRRQVTNEFYQCNERYFKGKITTLHVGMSATGKFQYADGSTPEGMICPPMERRTCDYIPLPEPVQQIQMSILQQMYEAHKSYIKTGIEPNLTLLEYSSGHNFKSTETVAVLYKWTPQGIDISHIQLPLEADEIVSKIIPEFTKNQKFITDADGRRYLEAVSLDAPPKIDSHLILQTIERLKTDGVLPDSENLRNYVEKVSTDINRDIMMPAQNAKESVASEPPKTVEQLIEDETRRRLDLVKLLSPDQQANALNDLHESAVSAIHKHCQERHGTQTDKIENLQVDMFSLREIWGSLQHKTILAGELNHLQHYNANGIEVRTDRTPDIVQTARFLSAGGNWHADSAFQKTEANTAFTTETKIFVSESVRLDGKELFSKVQASYESSHPVAQMYDRIAERVRDPAHTLTLIVRNSNYQASAFSVDASESIVRTLSDFRITKAADSVARDFRERSAIVNSVKTEYVGTVRLENLHSRQLKEVSGIGRQGKIENINLQIKGLKSEYSNTVIRAGKAKEAVLNTTALNHSAKAPSRNVLAFYRKQFETLLRMFGRDAPLRSNNFVVVLKDLSAIFRKLIRGHLGQISAIVQLAEGVLKHLPTPLLRKFGQEIIAMTFRDLSRTISQLLARIDRKSTALNTSEIHSRLAYRDVQSLLLNLRASIKLLAIVARVDADLLKSAETMPALLALKNRLTDLIQLMLKNVSLTEMQRSKLVRIDKLLTSEQLDPLALKLALEELAEEKEELDESLDKVTVRKHKMKPAIRKSLSKRVLVTTEKKEGSKIQLQKDDFKRQITNKKTGSLIISSSNGPTGSLDTVTMRENDSSNENT